MSVDVFIKTNGGIDTVNVIMLTTAIPDNAR